MKMKSQESLSLTKVRGNLQLSVFQKIQGILNLKERNDHIISIYRVFDCEKDLRSRAHGRHGGSQRERGYLENVYEYHSSSSSSSWSGL